MPGGVTDFPIPLRFIHLSGIGLLLGEKRIIAALCPIPRITAIFISLPKLSRIMQRTITPFPGRGKTVIQQ